MTDARFGGLGREALVSSTGELRAGGLVREALVSGIGLAGRIAGRSAARGAPSVLFAGIILSGSAKAQSGTRAGRLSQRINIAARVTARSSLRASLPAPPAVLAGRIGARSSMRVIRTTCAVWDGGTTIWDDGASDWDCPVIMTGRIGSASRAESGLSAVIPSTSRQYAVTVT